MSSRGDVCLTPVNSYVSDLLMDKSFQGLWPFLGQNVDMGGGVSIQKAITNNDKQKRGHRKAEV
jgi:hypothetical protein